VGEDRRRTLRECLQAIRDPAQLAAAVLAMATSTADEDLEPLREAILRLAAIDVELQRITVQAVDTDWTSVTDRVAEMRKLLAAAPDHVARALEYALAPWFAEPYKEFTDWKWAPAVAANGGGRKPPRKNGGGQHAKPPEHRYGARGPDPVDPVAAPAAEVPVGGVAPPSPYVGFTDPDEPERVLADTTLRCGGRYWLWFTIAGERPAGAIDTAVAPLPALPEHTLLQVVVFGYSNDSGIPPAGLCGWIRLGADGTSVVERQPLDGDYPQARADGTLFFSCRAPLAPGTLRLRCSIYHRANLLQSRLVTARVTQAAEPDPQALRAELDYAISSTLAKAQLEGLGEQRLCLMLNQSSDDTHGLRFVGASEFRASSTVGEGTLTTAVKTARAALARAAWGSPEPWDESRSYRYEGAKNRKRLFEDLAVLARAGWRLYFELCDSLAGEKPAAGGAQADDPSDALQELMRTPGSVHVALRQGAKHVLPAAMLYDRFLDDQQDFTICPGFAAALDQATPLGDTPCFQGSCPSRALDTVVCPSGFWGFRHRLGLPVAVEQGDDAPTSISASAGARVIMCVSDDFKDVYEPHRDAIAALGATVTLTDDRNQALQSLGAEDDQIVYFFCHGGSTASVPPVPTLVLKKGGMVITASNLGNIRWAAPRSRPLVVMNGCHTAAHDPETILGFVDAFVKKCRAVGVIGTEITIFPSLARAFGDELFAAFLGGRAIGDAMRHARLALLQKHENPLGLVYIPYVCNGVQLRAG
jgi:hypothetical protein